MNDLEDKGSWHGIRVTLSGKISFFRKHLLKAHYHVPNSILTLGICGSKETALEEKRRRLRMQRVLCCTEDA
jgi:hypothetical protein